MEHNTTSQVGRKSKIHDVRSNWDGWGSLEQILATLTANVPEALIEIERKSGVEVSERTLRRWMADWTEQTKGGRNSGMID